MWSDFENAFDPDWAEKLGVDLDRVIVQKYTEENRTMEDSLDTALVIIHKTRAIDMWVIDSIGALLPKGDILTSKDKEKPLEGEKMLHLQKKLGEFFRKANVLIAPTEATEKKEGYPGCAVVCIGQIYSVPSDVAAGLEEVRGGNAFKHWAHLRLMLRRGPRSDWPEPIDMIGLDGKKRKIFPGWAGRIKVDKTRINGNENQELLLTFMLGRGFDSKNAIMSAAFGLGAFERNGPMYSCDLLPDGKMKGKENLIQYFMNNEEAFNKLVDRVNQLALEGSTSNVNTTEDTTEESKEQTNDEPIDYI